MRNQSGHHCGKVSRVVTDDLVFDLEDMDMDGQSKTQQGSNQRKKMDRRRIAIAAALMMMGAVLIDPALLDDMNMSVQLSSDTDSNGEPMDEFAQIEFMLSQSETHSPSTSDPDPQIVHQETTAIATVAEPDTPEPAAVGVLMIPQQTPTTTVIESTETVASSDSPELTIPLAMVSSTQAVESLPVPQSVSGSTPPDAVNTRNSRTTIRLTGTIDPIR